VERAAIDRQLSRRAGGHGRGARMEIERDAVEILGGVRFGYTLGSPVSLLIRNRDHVNWREALSPDGPRPGLEAARAVTHPRPGHADLAGALKYLTHDARDVLERASARETAARTAAGALVRRLLAEAGIEVTSHTLAVGEVRAPEVGEQEFDELVGLDDHAPLRTLSAATSESMVGCIERARAAGDSVGGSFEVLVRGAPPGLGSHVHWDRRLDGRLASALMSIPAVKAVSVGEGIEISTLRGSETHDAIIYDRESRSFRRSTNRAGGIEGGMSNGEMIRVRGYLKPLATLPRPLPSADLITKEPFEAQRERTDTVPIVAAGVVAEAMVAWVLGDELLQKFGGDRLQETLANLHAYRAALADY
jgi:chorismate synthase